MPHSMMVFVEGDKILQRDEKKGSGGGVRGEEGTLIERPRDKGMSRERVGTGGPL